MKAIEASNLRKTYLGGVRALDGLSFAVETGTIFGLLGPNGAGKSTTVRILTTLSRADSGEARVHGIAGVAVLIGVAALLGAVFASLSNGIAVLARQRETLIGIVTMATLPLTFLSTALMQQSLLPGWIRWAARFNPVNWAAEAGRSAAGPDADWGLIASRAGFLALLLLASAAFATRAFNAYQRSA